MAIDALEIERLVRAVLAELGDAPQATATPPAVAPAKPAPVEKAEKPAAPGELVLTGRVITLAELGERLSGVRRLVVPPRAIVTPSVRDELRRRNVELVFGHRNGAARTTASVSLAMAVHGRRFEAGPLVQLLASDGIATQPQPFDCIIAATDQLAQEVSGGKSLGLLLTQHTAAGLCLANRHAGVRAVLGSDGESVARDAVAVGANLLVLDPVKQGMYRAKQLIGQFYRLGLKECPKVFESKLG